MRLFTAIELTDAAREAIAAEQTALASRLRRAGESGVRFVRPEHMHLTLSFIGEVADQAAAIVTAMTEDLPVSPFEIGFGGIGVFPARGAPRVLWLGVRAGGQAVVDLQRIVAKRLAVAGVGPERRAFHPHLALARWRDRHIARRGAPAELTDESRDRAIARVTVPAVTLFQSRLSSAGPSYTALARARLVG